MNTVTIQKTDSSSPLYQQVLQVREEVLRRPLGMTLKNEDLSRDAKDTIFIALQDENVVGCVMMHPVDPSVIRLRAMAVYDDWQGKGVGRSLVEQAEQYAREEGYGKIVLHARVVAMEFYNKLGYDIVSNEFTEVGIPHVIMEKVFAQ